MSTFLSPDGHCGTAAFSRKFRPDQSYSERQIYEAALDRLSRELAAIEKIDERSATERLEKVLRAVA